MELTFKKTYITCFVDGVQSQAHCEKPHVKPFLCDEKMKFETALNLKPKVKKGTQTSPPI